jgi:hypothetical protein
VLSLLCHLFFFANTLLKVLHEMFVWFLPLVAWNQLWSIGYVFLHLLKHKNKINLCFKRLFCAYLLSSFVGFINHKILQQV